MQRVMRSPIGVDGGLDFFASNSHLAIVSDDGEHPESKSNATGNRIPGTRHLEFLELSTSRLNAPEVGVHDRHALTQPRCPSLTPGAL